MTLNQIIQGDALTTLKTLPTESVDCIVTSPPYWGLRDYGVSGQLGSENTPEAFVEVLVGTFAECRRVLKKEGTLWLNLGDCYATSTKGGIKSKPGDKNHTNRGTVDQPLKKLKYGVKPKDIVGIPWRVAFALQADGWYLRSDIIWAKQNCMPESVTDRPTRSHEYVFLLSKNSRYYYNHAAIREPSTYTDARLNKGRFEYNGKRQGVEGTGVRAAVVVSDTRNKRDVWFIPTAAFVDAHFATFPEALIEPMILAGTPPQRHRSRPIHGRGDHRRRIPKIGQKLGWHRTQSQIHRHSQPAHRWHARAA